MATDTEKALRGMVRSGTVSEINERDNMARVTFDDKDSTTSAQLHILHMFSSGAKHHYCPEIGDQVVCLFENNDKNFTKGWILGSYFTEKQPPQVQSADIVRVDFGDGGYVEYDRSKSSLDVRCPGTIRITGGMVYINE